ncbi:MAG: zinc metalloprotease HtpX [Phycisphaeraceae bacterium]|nr:zinc metalloprotease HtpX [Phycisphaeraceae bacterium]
MTRLINNTKTALLLGGLFGLILLVGAQFGQQGLIFAFIFGGMTNIAAFFFSDKIAIASMRGQEVDERSAPDLVTMIRRLSQNAGLPMPRVYVCPQEAPNAFATGRSPRHAAVAVTQGALRLLSYDELEGVMAHELAHVKNRDTLTSTVAATIAGALSMLGYMAFWFGGLGGSNSREGGNPLVGLLLLITAPIAAAIIQMAISRSREYVADADGARIAGTPHGLANALAKLDAMAKRIPLHGEMPAQSHMFIVQPLSAGETLAGLFSTHPPTEKRIAKLRAIT